MTVSGTLYTPEGYHRSWRAQIAAKFGGCSLKIVNFIPGVTDNDKKFLDKFPPATVPVFEADDGTCLFDVNAIAYYLGTDQLRGKWFILVRLFGRWQKHTLRYTVGQLCR